MSKVGGLLLKTDQGLRHAFGVGDEKLNQIIKGRGMVRQYSLPRLGWAGPKQGRDQGLGLVTRGFKGA